jgi:hypothetical protein
MKFLSDFFFVGKEISICFTFKKAKCKYVCIFSRNFQEISILSEKKLPYSLTCRKTKSKCLHLCKKFLRFFFFLLGKKLSYGLRLEKPNLKYLFERNFQIFCFVLNKTFIDHMVLVLEKRYTL